MLINFSDPSKFTISSFLNAVNNFPNKNFFDSVPVNVYRQGIAKGILKGGNLITLTALIGTNWEINTNGSILFFEEVEEKLHGIDRCLTQWILKGKFKKIKGLLLGNFKGFNTKDVYKILSEQMKIDFPVVRCPYIGHLKNKITLPVGATVELNTYKKTLTSVLSPSGRGVAERHCLSDEKELASWQARRAGARVLRHRLNDEEEFVSCLRQSRAKPGGVRGLF